MLDPMNKELETHLNALRMLASHGMARGSNHLVYTLARQNFQDHFGKCQECREMFKATGCSLKETMARRLFL